MFFRAQQRGRHLCAQLTAPVDIASLCALRGLFGLILCGASLRFMAKGWIDHLLVAPHYHFTYAQFLKVQPLSVFEMQLVFSWLAVSSFCIAIGFCYRVAVISFLAAFLYVELIDQAIYLNHYYLVSLVAFLLALFPLGRACSVDAWLARKWGRLAATSAAAQAPLTQVPSWVLYVFRFQVGVVYCFAGLAKLNSDWLLRAQPLRIWLNACSDLPLVGPWLTEPVIAYVAAFGSAVFDLLIPLLLLTQRTRVVASLTLLGFHIATGVLFPIGVFPWLMSALATILWPAHWPRALWGRFQRSAPPEAAFDQTTQPSSLAIGSSIWKPGRVLPWLAALHCAVQGVLPLRGLADPAESAWTRRGFNFAWKVMLTEKTGYVTFRARDRATGETLEVDPSSFLKRFQTEAMAQDPHLVHQAAQFIVADFRAQGRNVAVYADAVATLNGRPAQTLIDPRVDLSRPLPEHWITPLATP